MSEYDQIPYQHTRFQCAEFADNPEPRCPCLLLLDTSTSMAGRPIQQLNDGLKAFRSDLDGDELSAKRVEVAIVTFGPVKLEREFETADRFDSPELTANGDTPIGAAIEFGIELIEQRKHLYRANGIGYFRPWIFLVTDGAPTDAWEAAAHRVREGEQDRKFMFFSVGVETADFDVLRRISVREPLRLRGLQFRELFRWLSNSLADVSRSRPGDAVILANPTSPNGWARVE